MLDNSKWICMKSKYQTCCPVFRKKFKTYKSIECAYLIITSIGCYEAYINKNRIGDFVLAPGWTSYESRLQVQEYDITKFIGKENILDVYVGEGWHLGRISNNNRHSYSAEKPAVILELRIVHKDGSVEKIVSDESFVCASSNILYSSIYDGEIFDSRHRELNWESVNILEYSKNNLISQEGEEIHEIERIKPISISKLSNGKSIIDFGQNLTGYVEFKCSSPEGTVIELVHGEILDSNGDVYTANLRTAKQNIKYIANGKENIYKPHFTFQGFRYVSVENMEVNADEFTAVVIHSDMKRTGYFKCSNEKINKLYQNIIWGQRSNYVDVPMDCPQRDERLGWTGDAQMFLKAAAYNYNVHKFFVKWLNDLRSDQYEDGGIPEIIPDVLDGKGSSSAAWGDAAVICPWTIYLFYDDKEMLSRHYESMEKWILYIKAQGDNEYIWDTGFHFGDWLALDAKKGEYIGATPKALIATAFFAYSTSIFIKVGKILGYNMSEYKDLYKKIVQAYKKEFIKDGRLISETQTAYAISILFDLSDDLKKFGAILNDMIVKNGYKMNTGFVGTPYILHALTKAGYVETAYSLLLQEEFPSWLYSVNLGATTVWEHWDSMDENGHLWSDDMNSFNHYAYGAVCDWMYETIAGIKIDEEKPAFENVILSPIPDKRLKWAEAKVDTAYGTVESKWKFNNNKIEYEFTVPNQATLILNGEISRLEKGIHKFVCDKIG